MVLEGCSAKPNAPLVIFEGEKAADAAPRIFPRSVCLTSSGGSQAAAKSDWSPLTGRKILIWPDADEPGEKYAVTIAGFLHKLRCDVSIIDAVALASLAPDGGQREAEKGWDAADAVAQWGGEPWRASEGSGRARQAV